MHRYILTGAPGAGKTTLLHALAARGLPVVREAATDINREAMAAGDPQPWLRDGFLEAVVLRQRERLDAAGQGPVQLHDRSAVCTRAPAAFLRRPGPPALRRELRRVLDGRLFRRRVFFVRHLGLAAPTTVRRISLAEALRFEAIHARLYRRLGFELFEVPRADVATRAALVLAAIAEDRREPPTGPGFG